MRETMKRMGAMLLVITMMLVMCVQGGILVTVHADTVTGRVPIVCYTSSTGRVKTYTSAGEYSGYIDGYTDKVTILKVYDDNWCYVSYPTSRGSKKAYTKSSNFFCNTNFLETTTTLGVRKNVYRRSNLSQTIGTVYADDEVVIVGHLGNKTQIIYPISGGYKLGWISGKYTVANGEEMANVSNGYYQIKSALNSNYVLDIYRGAMSDGANLQIYRNNFSTNQGFLIKKQSDGYYTIAAIHSGKLLDVDHGYKTDGTNVMQYMKHGADNQKWKIVKTLDGYYSFISKCNGLYLDVADGIAANETNVRCFTGNGTKAQKFILESVTVGGNGYTDEEQEEVSQSGSTTSSNAVRQQIVNYELSQLGVGDYRGNNNVIYNTWYWGRTINGSGYAWCMAFQAYAANQCGVLDTAIPRTASCANAIDWYKQRGQFHLSNYYGGNYTPQAGDLVFYGSNGSEHVGLIVASPVNGYLQVVEGNVRNVSGNYTVQQFTRNAKRTLTNSYVYGYASPNY